MSGRFVHCVTGMGVGGVASAYMAYDQPRDCLVLEVIGGLLTGYLGARLPDITDPPTSPNHRNVGHGFLTAAGIGMIVLNNLEEWQSAIRAKADEMRAVAAVETNQLLKAAYQVADIFLRLLRVR